MPRPSAPPQHTEQLALEDEKAPDGADETTPKGGQKLEKAADEPAGVTTPGKNTESQSSPANGMSAIVAKVMATMQESDEDRPRQEQGGMGGAS